MSDTLAVEPASYIEMPAQGQDLKPISSVPWIAIALAAHVLFLVIAWFIVPLMPDSVKPTTMATAVDTQPMPPEPALPPPDQTPWPEDNPPEKEYSEAPNISPEATEVNNQDPTDEPNKSLAKHDSPDDNPAESPSPFKNPNSSNGLGGGGGGSGVGGKGGNFPERAKRGGPPGGTDRTQAALEWLKDHQNVEGYWSSTQFSEDSTRKNARKTYNLEFVKPGDPKGDIGWTASADIGLTGLSLLAFLCNGYDHTDGTYKNACRRAVMYLRKVQYNDGCFGPKDEDCFVYNHAICTMAVAEAYGMSGDSALRRTTETAVQFILDAQNPGMGWRYGVKAIENDTSVTGWMVLALKSAKYAGIEFDAKRVYGDASKWLDTVTVDSGGYPKTGYNLPGSDNARLRSAQHYASNPSMDAINIMTRLFMGDAKWTPENRTIRSQAAECARNVPVWDHTKIDYYYWYYASLALFQVDGSAWKAWEAPMTKVLFDNQRGYRLEDKGSTAATLDEHGSWDAVDAWSSCGGRVYATAINCLTLGVWYRYKKEHEKK